MKKFEGRWLRYLNDIYQIIIEDYEVPDFGKFCILINYFSVNKTVIFLLKSEIDFEKTESRQCEGYTPIKKEIKEIIDSAFFWYNFRTLAGIENYLSDNHCKVFDELLQNFVEGKLAQI